MFVGIPEPSAEPWALIHWDGDFWTARPILRARFRTRKDGLKARCSGGHTTKCCTVQPYDRVF